MLNDYFFRDSYFPRYIEWGYPFYRRHSRPIRFYHTPITTTNISNNDEDAWWKLKMENDRLKKEIAELRAKDKPYIERLRDEGQQGELDL